MQGGAPAGDPAAWARLAANESSQGCSPLVLEAVARGSGSLNRYPDPQSRQLRAALARRFDLPEDGIICGNGSEAVIESIVRCYARPGDEVVFGEYTFIQFRIFASRVGATPVAAPERAHTASVDALLAAVTARTTIVILDNPGNPTGTTISASEVRRLRDGLRPDIVLVLDSAYAEYVDAPDYTAGHDIAAESGNVIVTRTFSKAFGLAALRVGWAHGARELIAVLERVKQIGNVNALAQVAAVAALDNMAFMRAAVAETILTRRRTTSALNALGLHPLPSQTNFICLGFPDAACARTAWQALLDDGIAVRRIDDYGLPAFLRVGIGTDAEMDRTLASLTRHLATAGA
ncbi:histidinol-phosphate transaminase [Roseomonas sp. CAU 1739]|uniref:pyridoxal phosphate-dependent aminotransferase n=1 Tax=Roseomonas sp. CAU 1739 TaxID=3140364 RepID=UPI00325B11D8